MPDGQYVTCVSTAAMMPVSGEPLAMTFNSSALPSQGILLKKRVCFHFNTFCALSGDIYLPFRFLLKKVETS